MSCVAIFPACDLLSPSVNVSGTRRFPVTLFVFSAKWPLERGQLRKT